MNIWTPYELMEKSAKLCPSGQNIKLLIRHSIRQDKETEEAQLTREGRKIAERLGKSFNSGLGSISSSYSRRCIDTCQEIINGYNSGYIKYEADILKTEMLQCPHIKKENKAEADLTWKKLGMEGVFDCFSKNTDMPGFYNLETSSKRLIDYVLETGNQNNTVDLFCTHDFQLAMLLLFFNGDSHSYKQDLFKNDNWPFMLEGMFIWKHDNKINIAWRGKITKISI